MKTPSHPQAKPATRPSRQKRSIDPAVLKLEWPKREVFEEATKSKKSKTNNGDRKAVAQIKPMKVAIPKDQFQALEPGKPIPDDLMIKDGVASQPQKLPVSEDSLEPQSDTDTVTPAGAGSTLLLPAGETSEQREKGSEPESKSKTKSEFEPESESGSEYEPKVEPSLEQKVEQQSVIEDPKSSGRKKEFFPRGFRR